ncbi:MAG: phosphotransferase family protein [Dehalococcoidia bacterium]|nr:phosphotransferase family protein [Dehalococcoidia bacterium]
MEPDEVREGLIAFLAEKTGATVSLQHLERLSGGASRETWTFDATFEGPGAPPPLAGIFRADPFRGVPSSPGRRLEFSLIKAAWDRGVTVPEPLWDGDDRFGVSFFVMRRVEGETLGARIVRNDEYAEARKVLPEQLATSLARIHNVLPAEAPELAELPGPADGVSPAHHELDTWEANYREVEANPHPTLELALRWLRNNAPASGDRRLVHGDYRMGNFIIGEDGLRGVIDWELAHWGDPMEDLGWLCVRSWRFGGKEPVAGVGDRESFFRAYEEASGRKVDPEAVRFWEVFGNLRWGIITVMQANGYLSGRTKSVELASIGRRTVETEWELLNLMEGSAW